MQRIDHRGTGFFGANGDVAERPGRSCAAVGVVERNLTGRAARPCVIAGGVVRRGKRTASHWRRSRRRRRGFSEVDVEATGGIADLQIGELGLLVIRLHPLGVGDEGDRLRGKRARVRTCRPRYRRPGRLCAWPSFTRGDELCFAGMFGGGLRVLRYQHNLAALLGFESKFGAAARPEPARIGGAGNWRRSAAGRRRQLQLLRVVALDWTRFSWRVRSERVRVTSADGLDSGGCGDLPSGRCWRRR